MNLKKKIYIIAEIGINHNGSLKNALKLIDLAKETGCDFVKFQKRDPDITTPEKFKKKLRQTPWGLISYLDYKKRIELSHKDYIKINNYCKKKNIKWFASIWDLNSLNFFNEFKINYYKVPSAMLTNYSLLNLIAKKRKFTFISTGMTKSIDQIKKAIKIFEKNRCKFLLMHSVGNYPCEEKNLNLSMIKTLIEKFNLPIGYSGHEKTVSPSLMAACFGARVIERHITLDRTMWGTDQSASLEKNGLIYLRELLDKFYIAKGDGKKKILETEKKKLKTMRYW